MTALRRAVIAVALAGVVALVIRLNGSEGTTITSGGWRELAGPDLE